MLGVTVSCGDRDRTAVVTVREQRTSTGFSWPAGGEGQERDLAAGEDHLDLPG